jgi:hypothetical protein
MTHEPLDYQTALESVCLGALEHSKQYRNDIPHAWMENQVRQQVEVVCPGLIARWTLPKELRGPVPEGLWYPPEFNKEEE